MPIPTAPLSSRTTVADDHHRRRGRKPHLPGREQVHHGHLLRPQVLPCSIPPFPFPLYVALCPGESVRAPEGAPCPSASDNPLPPHPTRPPLPQIWPKLLRSLFADMWHQDYALRPSFGEIVHRLKEVKGPCRSEAPTDGCSQPLSCMLDWCLSDAVSAAMLRPCTRQSLQAALC